jgi:hypothetical protein
VPVPKESAPPRLGLLAIFFLSLIVSLGDVFFIWQQAVAHNAPPMPVWLPLPNAILLISAFNYFLSARYFKKPSEIRTASVVCISICAISLSLLFIDWLDDIHNVTLIWPPKHESILTTNPP